MARLGDGARPGAGGEAALPEALEPIAARDLRCWPRRAAFGIDFACGAANGPPAAHGDLVASTPGRTVQRREDSLLALVQGADDVLGALGSHAARRSGSAARLRHPTRHRRDASSRSHTAAADRPLRLDPARSWSARSRPTGRPEGRRSSRSWRQPAAARALRAYFDHDLDIAATAAALHSKLAALPARARRAGPRAVAQAAVDGRGGSSRSSPRASRPIGSRPMEPNEQPTAPYLDAVVGYAFRGPARHHVPGHKGGPGADPGLRKAMGPTAWRWTSRRTSTGSTGPSPTPYERAERLAAEATARRARSSDQRRDGATTRCAWRWRRSAPDRRAATRTRRSSIISVRRCRRSSPEYDDELGITHRHAGRARRRPARRARRPRRVHQSRRRLPA